MALVVGAAGYLVVQGKLGTGHQPEATAAAEETSDPPPEPARERINTVEEPPKIPVELVAAKDPGTPPTAGEEAPEECPAGPPGDGHACRAPANTSRTCAWGDAPNEVVCSCEGMEDALSVWHCQMGPPETPALCPELRPAQGSACSPRGHTCFFHEGENQNYVCVCDAPRRGPGWACMTRSEWHGPL